jgi:phage N-6-adenine-methyltransferase
MITSGMMTSKTDLWSTPQDFFAKLDAEFHFTLDVCATADNAKCKRFFSPEDDGLHSSWYGTCWMNPPYGRAIGEWMQKAYDSSRYWKCTVVCLVPARTDTAWWHDFAMKGEIRFIRGRLKFGGSKNGAPFPSAVVIFRPEGEQMDNTTAEEYEDMRRNG